jgi:hypothetical protein
MKKNPFVSYISKITFLSIAVCFLSLLLVLVVPKGFITRNVPYYIVMYYAVTILGYAGVYFLPQKTTLKFENVFLMTKIIKFLIYLLVLVVVFLGGIEKNAKFAVAYLVLFLIYQVFDTITLTQLIKKK